MEHPRASKNLIENNRIPKSLMETPAILDLPRNS
jgi:hypothetical protein